MCNLKKNVNRWVTEKSFIIKFISVWKQTHTSCLNVCWAKHLSAWTCSLWWSEVMFAWTWALNHGYISRVICSTDGRGQSRGALVLTPLLLCLIAGKHPSAKGPSAEGSSTMSPLFVKLRQGTREVCVSVCTCVCVCVSHTDSVGRLNESYNVNQAQSN